MGMRLGCLKTYGEDTSTKSSTGCVPMPEPLAEGWASFHIAMNESGSNRNHPACEFAKAIQ